MILFKRIIIPCIIIFCLLVIVVFAGAYQLEKNQDVSVSECRLELVGNMSKTLYDDAYISYMNNNPDSNLEVFLQSDEFYSFAGEVLALFENGMFVNILDPQSICVLYTSESSKVELNTDGDKNVFAAVDQVYSDIRRYPVNPLFREIQVNNNNYNILFYNYSGSNAQDYPVFCCTFQTRTFAVLIQDSAFQAGICLLIFILFIVSMLLVLKGFVSQHFNEVMQVFASFGSADFSEKSEKLGVFSAKHKRVFQELSVAGEKVRDTLSKAINEKEKALVALYNLGAGVMVLDKNGVVVSVNEIGEELIGIRRDEIEGEFIDDVVTIKTIENEDFGYERFLQKYCSVSDHVVAEKIIFIDKNAREYVLDVGVCPVLDDSGVISERIVFFRDVTVEYKEQEYLSSANKNLLEQVGDMALILDVAKIATWEADGISRKIKANQRLFDMLHISSKHYEISFDEILSRVVEKDKLLNHIITQIHHTGASFISQVGIKGDDGKLRWLLFVGKGQDFNQKGGVSSLHGIALDITESIIIKKELLHREQVINASNKRLQQIYNLAKLLFWEYGYDTKCIVGGENFSKMFIDPAGTLRTIALKDFYKMIASADLNKADRIVRQCIAKRELTGVYEFGIEDLDGRFRYFRNYINFEYQDENSNILDSTCGVLLDITKEKEQEIRLIHSSKMESLGRISGGIAHDLNNILGGIMGMADLLRSRINSTDISSQKYLENIYTTCVKSTGFLRHVLNFSRRDEHSFESIDICQVINSTVTILTHSIGKNIEITVDLNIDDVRIYGEDVLLQNAILNMGTNARDAIGSDNSGTLRIAANKVCFNSNVPEVIIGKVSADTEYLKIDIEDSGTGLQTDNFHKIFESFYTTKGKGKGTGLGLAAVANTVIAHNGAIVVESTSGKGATFSIFLPVDKSFVPVEKFEVEEEKFSGCILFVSNIKAIKIIYKELLENYGYKVDFADTTIEALGCYKKHNGGYIGVILDARMLEWEGVYDALFEIEDRAKILLLADDADSPEYKIEKYNRSNVIITDNCFRQRKLLEFIKKLFV